MRKLVLLALTLLGLFDSIFLWWMYTDPSRSMVCLTTGCDAVRASAYSHLGGIPLPVFGVAMYAALALVVFTEPLFSDRWARIFSFGIVAISGGGFLASLYLTGLEAFVIHSWCEWCVISAVTVTFIFCLALWDWVRPSVREGGPSAIVSLRRYVTVIMVAILVGVPAFIFLSRAEAEMPVGQASQEALREHLIRQDSHTFGNPLSPVIVVEFGDFQCPFCGTMEKTVRKIREAYQGRVRFIFRQFPLPKMHANAQKAAEASECAAEQGRFWEAFEKFYDHQEDLSVPALEHYAGELGLDKTRFSQCLETGAMAGRVEQDAADGRALGVDRTPTFFVDGQKIVGGMEYDKFAQLLDKELAIHGLPPAAGNANGSPQADVNSGGKSATEPAKPVTKATTAPASKTPAADSSVVLPGSSFGAGIFTQSSGSLAACSEAEANQRQPALIDTPQARDLFQSGSKPLFVDVRPAGEFAKGRIQGALNVPLDDLEKRWSQLPKDRNIVLYESGLSANPDDICASGRAAGRFLLSHGFSPDLVKVYHDGLKAWEKAGLPVDHGPTPGS